jgi:DHA1 family inner membrane transport protein
VLARTELLLALLLTLAYFVAIFSVFSCIGPVLRALVPMSTGALSLTLSLFGVSGMVGTLVGGVANDRFSARASLSVQLALLGTMMLWLPLTVGHYGVMLTVLLLWGTAGFGRMVPQQARLALLAPREAPLLLSLNTSMLYLGSALGTALGGLAAPSVGFGQLAWVDAAGAAMAVVLLAISPDRRRPAVPLQSAPQPPTPPAR